MKNMPTFAPFNSRIDAQMAESVDALVSNTSRFTPVPVRPRLWVPEEKFERTSLFLCRFVAYYFTKQRAYMPRIDSNPHGQLQQKKGRAMLIARPFAIIY